MKRILSTTTLAACAAAALSGQTAPVNESDEVFALKDFTVTTGTRTERLLVDVPIKTDLLGRAELDSAGVSNLGQALEMLNGARTEANCQNCGASEIQLLGLPGNYNQILIDGLPLFTGAAAIYGIDQVPTIFVERIEVVKGGGSALYGPGAVAGVINVIPKEPFESHSHVDFSFKDVDGEPLHQTQFSSYFVSEDKSFKAALYGLYGDRSEYDANGDGFTEIGERENETVGTYLWWTPTEETRLRFNYQFKGEDRRGGDRLDVPQQFSQVAESTDTSYQWASVRWDQELNDDLSMTLSLAYVDFERDSYYGGSGDVVVDPSDPNIDFENRIYISDPDITAALFGDPTDGSGGGSFNNFGFTDAQSYFVDASFEWDAGELGNTGIHRFVFGFQYEDETLKDDQLDAAGNFLAVLHDTEYENFGVFFHDEWMVTDQLEFIPGFRFDKTNTLDDWVLSPRLAARYTATSELTLRGNFSTGFLAPRTFDEDLHIESIAGIPTDIQNADGLKEERSYTFAFGADYTPDSLDGRLVSALQVYYTILEDSFRIEEATGIPGPNGRETIQRINTEGSTIFGVEMDLSYELDENWSMNAGLAYANTRYDEAQEIFDGVFTDQYNKVADWTGLAQLIYENDAFLDAFFALKWVGESEVARESTETLEETPNFFVVDLGISKDFEFEHYELTLKAGVENIFNEFQDDFESGVDRDPGYIYGPRAPRTFTLGAKIHF